MTYFFDTCLRCESIGGFSICVWEMRDKIKDSLDSLQINTPDDFQKAMIELYKTQNANRKAY